MLLEVGFIFFILLHLSANVTFLIYLTFIFASTVFLGRYFDEISQNTGKYVYGVTDTLTAMEMGAVDILIVWENLDIQRFVLKNHSSDGNFFFFFFLKL